MLFFDEIERNPILAKDTLTLLSKQLRISENRMFSLAYKSVKERVAEGVIMLADAYGFDDDGKTICTASSQYQKIKYKELETQKTEGTINEEEFKDSFTKLTSKECLCNGLSTSVMHINNLDRKLEKEGVSICPGPNLAYYSKTSTLQDMTNHIYGIKRVMQREDRPNMFIKELSLHMDFLQNKLEDAMS